MELRMFCDTCTRDRQFPQIGGAYVCETCGTEARDGQPVLSVRPSDGRRLLDELAEAERARAELDATDERPPF